MPTDVRFGSSRIPLGQRCLLLFAHSYDSVTQDSAVGLPADLKGDRSEIALEVVDHAILLGETKATPEDVSEVGTSEVLVETKV